MNIRQFELIYEENIPKLKQIRNIKYKNDSIMSYGEMVYILNTYFDMEKMATEHVYVFAFNGVMEPNGIYLLSSGSYKGSMFSQRDLAIFLLLVGAEKFAVFHNHPNGILEESFDDIIITNKIKELSSILDIEFIDHIIISNRGSKVIGKNISHIKKGDSA